jgi:hypothetical protein
MTVLLWAQVTDIITSLENLELGFLNDVGKLGQN